MLSPKAKALPMELAPNYCNICFSWGYTGCSSFQVGTGPLNLDTWVPQTRQWYQDEKRANEASNAVHTPGHAPNSPREKVGKIRWRVPKKGVPQNHPFE